MTTRRSQALLVAAVLCLAPAACGSDDSPSDDEPSKGSVAFETTEPSEGRVAIAGPATVEAGVTRITFRNSGEEPHDAQIVRVEGDRTVDEVISNTVDSRSTS